MEKRRTPQELETELRATEARLEEAEETLRAIRNNEVDALVIDGPRGQQVFTLQGAEQPYRTLMETMSEGALTVAADGTILYCNNQFSELIEMPLNGIMGVSVHDLVISRNGQSFEEMLHVCGKEACRREFFLRTARGREVPVLLSARLLPLNDEETFCIVATDLTDQKRAQGALERAQDDLEKKVIERTAELSQVNATLQEEISERKQAEIALQKSEQRWTATLSSIGDAVIATDTAGSITFMNPVAEALTGWTLSDALQRPVPEIFNIVNEQTRGQIENPVTKVLQIGMIVGLANHTILVRKDGTEVPIDDSGAPIRGVDGRTVGVVLVFRDITERRQTEKELKRHRDELELLVEERTAMLSAAYDDLRTEVEEREQTEQQLRQAQKIEALGVLSGGIAHDFNNILAAIIGFTELVASHTAKGSRDEHHLERVMQASIRGRELVRQMLTFSRKTEQEMKPLRLSGIVKETVKLLRASTPSTISIAVDVQSESDLILGDPVQIQQVLMNLCTNAAHAMREKGGILDIRLSDFSASPSNRNLQDMEPGLYMKLAVRDTGTGIAPDIIDRIFDPFFTTKNLGEGTGLGLSVVHGIVTRSGGSITVESEPGKGTTFSVYFPKTAEKPVPAAVGHEAVPAGSERILFVDDEESLVEMGEEILAELGYEVTSRTSSRQALALFRADHSRFDLVITDQTMPELTGIELAKEIMVIRPDMPIILCTGFSHLVDEELAKSLGIKAFAMKPLTKREIAQTIREVLDG